MMPPHVVVFDLGKVLVDFDYMIAARAIAAKANASAEAVFNVIHGSPLLVRFEHGHITNEEFYREVCAATGFRGSYDEFAPLFGDIFSAMPQMIELHGALKTKGVPTYIFSNTNTIAVGHIRNRFPFFSGFTGYIYSYEHGAMKPEAKLYEVVEKQSGQRQAEILYLDDRPENIAAGKANATMVCPKRP